MFLARYMHKLFFTMLVQFLQATLQRWFYNRLNMTSLLKFDYNIFQYGSIILSNSLFSI